MRCFPLMNNSEGQRASTQADGVFITERDFLTLVSPRTSAYAPLHLVAPVSDNLQTLISFFSHSKSHLTLLECFAVDSGANGLITENSPANASELITRRKKNKNTKP